MDNMTYDKQILRIMSEAGSGGISVQVLAKHVYNMNCGLFSSPDIGEIHRYVQQYLSRNSKSSQSLIESTGRRGYYRLNTDNSDDARQLMLEFRDETVVVKEEVPPVRDLSLDLFV